MFYFDSEETMAIMRQKCNKNPSGTSVCHFILGLYFSWVCFLVCMLLGVLGGSYLIEIIGEITLGRQAYCLSTYR